MTTPNYDIFIERCFGWPPDVIGSYGTLLAAGNIVIGSNPPYSANDFLALYPNFAGPAKTLCGVFTINEATITGIPNLMGVKTGQLVEANGLPPGTVILSSTTTPITFTGDTNGSQSITNVSSTAGLLEGMPITGAGIPAGAIILAIGTDSLTISCMATATATGISLAASVSTLTLSAGSTLGGTQPFMVYADLLIPMAVLNAYIYLATSSLYQARWCELWGQAMGLYIAHFATLWLRAAGRTPSNTAQAASQGLARGILTSKSADGLSMGFTPTPGLEDWGAFNLTEYGQLFATYAKAMGSGGMLVY